MTAAPPPSVAGSSLLHWPDDLPAFAPLTPDTPTSEPAAVSPYAQDTHTPRDLSLWIDRIKNANIDARRISSPNLLAQLHEARSARIDAIVCTLLDGDPALRLNAAYAAHHAPALTAAVRLLADLTAARRTWIVSDQTTPTDWLNPLRSPARALKLRLISLRNDYPQSDPTLLLYTLLGRKLKPALLPTQAGVLLLDAPAAVAIGQLLLHGQSRAHTPFAIHENSSSRAHYLTVPLGTRIQSILTHLNIPSQNSVLRLADPLRDLRAEPDSAIDAGELTLHHISPPEQAINPEPCIRCGWCVEGCPTRIQPAGILEAAQRNDQKLAEHFGLHACIQCGICTYVCPSQLPLLTAIRTLLTRSH
jgi:electron transport complex protein RnfC